MHVIKLEGNFSTTTAEVLHLEAAGYTGASYYSTRPCKGKSHPVGEPTRRYMLLMGTVGGARCAVCANVKMKKIFDKDPEAQRIRNREYCKRPDVVAHRLASYRAKKEAKRDSLKSALGIFVVLMLVACADSFTFNNAEASTVSENVEYYYED